LLIIGLDGGSFALLDPLVAEGHLPNLARLMREGARGGLLSTLPPATMPAWSSFLTGAPPGEHGVTDIFVRRGYALSPASGALRSLPTFLEVLSRRGRRVASIGVPGTYPPLELIGVCVSGFDAPGVHRASRASVSPPSFYSTLEELGGYRYATFNEQGRGRRRLAQAADALCADIARKERLLLALYTREPWDVFFTHLQASDTAAHHLWHTYDMASPRATERSDDLPRVYRRLDQLVGALLERTTHATRVLVVSDHGFGGASTTAVHLNRLLERAGLLRFREQRGGRTKSILRRALGELPPFIMGGLVRALPEAARSRMQQQLLASPIDWNATQAFSDELDYAPSIWLHCAGAFERGRVGEANVARLRGHIRELLLDLRDPMTGEPLVTAVHAREDTPMRGPHVERAPDLIIEPAWPRGYRPSFLRSDGPGEPVCILAPEEHAAGRGSGMAGVHHPEGILIVHGAGIAPRTLERMTIEQAGALVYELLGEAPPATVQAPPRAQAYTPRQQRAVESRLRSLGYID
jgi:predicted AlkP superfamily phosphohydrolase/phosphomutase